MAEFHTVELDPAGQRSMLAMHYMSTNDLKQKVTAEMEDVQAEAG